MRTVRPAHRGDLDALALHSMRLGEESEGRRPHPATVRDAIGAALFDPVRARYFVAEEDGEVVGSLFVTYEWSDWSNAWYWWIQGLYVVPPKRGRGVFSAMYRAVQRAARDAGDVARIRLYMHRDNPAAAVYRAVGMREEPYVVFDATVEGSAPGGDASA